MRSGRTVFRTAIAVLIIVSLGLKIRLRGLNAGVEPDWETHVAALARWNGFLAERIGQADSQLDRLALQNGDCRMVIVFSSPLGIHRDGVKRAASPSDDVVFLYRGHRYNDQPLWETVLDHYRRRLGRILGNTAQEHAVLGIISSPGCRSYSLDWLQHDALLSA